MLFKRALANIYVLVILALCFQLRWYNMSSRTYLPSNHLNNVTNPTSLRVDWISRKLYIMHNEDVQAGSTSTPRWGGKCPARKHERRMVVSSN